MLTKPADNITIKNIEIPWWYLLTLLTCIQLFWAREIRLDEGNALLLPKDTILLSHQVNNYEMG